MPDTNQGIDPSVGGAPRDITEPQPGAGVNQAAEGSLHSGAAELTRDSAQHHQADLKELASAISTYVETAPVPRVFAMAEEALERMKHSPELDVDAASTLQSMLSDLGRQNAQLSRWVGEILRESGPDALNQVLKGASVAELSKLYQACHPGSTTTPSNKDELLKSLTQDYVLKRFEGEPLVARELAELLLTTNSIEVDPELKAELTDFVRIFDSTISSLKQHLTPILLQLFVLELGDETQTFEAESELPRHPLANLDDSAVSTQTEPRTLHIEAALLRTSEADESGIKAVAEALQKQDEKMRQEEEQGKRTHDQRAEEDRLRELKYMMRLMAFMQPELFNSLRGISLAELPASFEDLSNFIAHPDPRQFSDPLI